MLFRDLLPNALMGSSPVEVYNVLIEHPLELLLAEDQQVVQAFLSDTPQKAFTDRIGSGSMNRCFEQLDATCPRHPIKARPKFAVVITNQVLWCVPIGGGFPQLLGHPGIGWRASDADVDHLP